MIEYAIKLKRTIKCTIKKKLFLIYSSFIQAPMAQRLKRYSEEVKMLVQF